MTPQQRFTQSWTDVRNDHANFYTPQNGALFLGVFAVGAAIANTPADQEFQDFYQEKIQNDFNSTGFYEIKRIGEGRVTIPIFAGALIAAEIAADTESEWGQVIFSDEMGQWGDRSLRAMLVGFPPMLATQLLTGGSRPRDNQPWDSRWQPFHDNNGVSGHSFMGAIPFITAAQMTDEPIAKAGLYAMSTLCAFSRVDEDAHYTSQAILGWSIAYVACSAVSQTETDLAGFQITPVAIPDGVGIGVVYER